MAWYEPMDTPVAKLLNKMRNDTEEKFQEVQATLDHNRKSLVAKEEERESGTQLLLYLESKTRNVADLNEATNIPGLEPHEKKSLEERLAKKLREIKEELDDILKFYDARKAKEANQAG